MKLHLLSHAARRGADPRDDYTLPLACLIIYAIVAVIAGIAPHSRSTWLLENIAGTIGVSMFVITYHRFRFSDRAYVQGLLMLLLHVIGSHYTYSLVPVGEWAKTWFGLSRNHFDRLVHFSFGGLVFLPMREFLFRDEPRRRLISELFMVAGLLALIGAGYEVLEWWAAVLVGSHGGDAFIGTQNDAWDTQKDLLAATLGSAVAALIEWHVSKGATRATARPG